ncbi:MAG: hypothetical protein FWE41_06370 [Coriobacteriia bacterium]|nr:hypothetical protein [Coriobacteriia bacterium]
MFKSIHSQYFSCFANIWQVLAIILAGIMWQVSADLLRILNSLVGQEPWLALGDGGIVTTPGVPAAFARKRTIFDQEMPISC